MAAQLNLIDNLAKRLLLRLRGQQSDPQHPLLELVQESLVDQEGSFDPPPRADLSQTSWNLFQQQASADPDQVSQDLQNLVEKENLLPPENPDQVKYWAEDLVLQIMSSQSLLIPDR